MKVKPIGEIEQALAPVAASVGVEIYEIAFKQGKNPSLTVFLDTEAEGGIDLDTCERFHNAADPVLDELDPTFGLAYTFNVSSPGLDRPFRKDRDFFRNVGKKVELLAYDPAARCVEIDKAGEVFKLNLTQIVKISQAIDFD